MATTAAVGFTRLLRAWHPFVCMLTAALCLHAVSTCASLNSEIFTVSARPINGTLQGVQCGGIDTMQQQQSQQQQQP